MFWFVAALEHQHAIGAERDHQHPGTQLAPQPLTTAAHVRVANRRLSLGLIDFQQVNLAESPQVAL